MAANKPRPTLADYVALAIGPGLIMALVGSLVFFLLEILYAGQYETRLRAIVFLFVFAAVLIARIAMTGGIAERAGLYGLLLAGATFLAMHLLVQYPPGSPAAEFRWAINAAVMGVVWWCAHRLTWDCTFIDETEDASGAGLLDAAGLGEAEGAERASERARPAEGGGLLGWWGRYRAYQKERQGRPHAPGVWVVYFSLAALPIFGLGQALIPAVDAGRRQYVFWLMVVYVASGLGLLLTTSFLGLRRYLRQRQLKMPAAVVGFWLAIGTGLVAVLLLLGALLPRPNAEYAVVRLPGGLSSPDRDASKYAVLRDSPGKGEGRPGAAGKDGRQGGADGSGSQGQGGGSKGHNGSGGNSAQGGANAGQGQGSGGNSAQAKNGSGQGNAQGGNGEKGSAGEGRGTQAGNRQGSRGGSGKPAGGGQGEKQAGQNLDRMAKGEHQGDPPASPPAGSSLSSLFHSLGRLLKWIVFAVLAVVVLAIVLRAVLKFLANFTGWARGLLTALQGLWQSLFGGGDRPGAAEAADEEIDPRRQLVPFSAFHNPFVGGADGRSPEELVRYSFEALEAWAGERGLERRGDDTPLEFADRIALEAPALAADCRRLVALYARAAYGQGRLPVACLAGVRQFWQKLEAEGEVAVRA